ncbi:hypothetical protein BKG82_06535 [Mycobacteroides chelonae]|uniref:Uncharacterized protein n=2 Tax=Mycobacteriaceae TaxID=1762 RepID=A0A1S1LQS5_MYCCH|nr:hypothetical protein AOT87_02440 [Mycobacteroides sp. H003]KRQ28725.1 hypothetical protein AOT91_18090 [Mycobacteroides sp. H092]KRQ44136.1 hypothetical protein AOT92_07390 [Mycobacteroides sp. H101]KRQ51006.1 hypothetical protein AOT88_06335 [Mycobacteroides sp. H063]KRQ57471.1 hypothetical protein AOT94_15985 [Mycobacteroides sp. HXVII]KRQ61858.1 hypothetical protein AOT90_17330 [Mycobacteroides sp. H079]KRQ74730.1 hypothetical protein AOT95_27945 [Mycobacteroides sp. HXXIII]KRQ82120.1 
MSLLNRMRDLAAEPEPAVEAEPAASSSSGCKKCAPAPINRGPKFGGHVAARSRGLPIDNGLRAI